jgi:phosphoserine aminotransferase
LRIWCGGTVDPADIAALLRWIKWAYAEEMARRN